MPVNPNAPVAAEWLTVADLKRRYCVKSSSTIWSWVSEGLLPQPHHIRQKAVWPVSAMAEADAKIVQPPRAA